MWGRASLGVTLAHPPEIFVPEYTELSISSSFKNPIRVRGKTGKINKRTLNKVIQKTQKTSRSRGKGAGKIKCKKPKKPLYQEEKLQEKLRQFLDAL